MASQAGAAHGLGTEFPEEAKARGLSRLPAGGWAAQARLGVEPCLHARVARDRLLKLERCKWGQHWAGRVTTE